MINFVVFCTLWKSFNYDFRYDDVDFFKATTTFNNVKNGYIYGKDISYSSSTNLLSETVQDSSIYAPVYGIYYNSEDYHINVYLLVPVYYAFTNASNVTNYVGTMKNYQCQLTELTKGIWVLPSNN